jgi:hypothetical protein
MLAILIIEGFAIGFLGLLVVGLLRSHAEILRRLHEMGEGLDDTAAPQAQPGRLGTVSSDGGATGGPAHDLSGQTLDGETVEIGLAGAAGNTLLAFLSASCYTCEPFWSALSAAVEVPGGARVIAVVQNADNQQKLRRLAGPDLLVVRSDSAWSDYDVPGSPHFAYVDGPAGRVVGEGTASTWPQVRDLLEQATGAAPTSPSIVPLPDGRDNAERIDLELLAAGIGPGHPSLYPDSQARPGNDVATG